MHKVHTDPLPLARLLSPRRSGPMATKAATMKEKIAEAAAKIEATKKQEKAAKKAAATGLPQDDAAGGDSPPPLHRVAANVAAAAATTPRDGGGGGGLRLEIEGPDDDDNDAGMFAALGMQPAFEPEIEPAPAR